MTARTRRLWVCGLAWLLVSAPLALAQVRELDEPHFQEILRLIRTQLAGVTEAELNRGMVQGLLTAFYPRVVLTTNEVSAEGAAPGALRATNVFDGRFVRLAVAEVGPGLAEQIEENLRRLAVTGQVQGLVLDLRGAEGRDFRAAAEVADRFVREPNQPLLRWDDNSVASTGRTNCLSLPTVLLVNGGTAGAAEALAAALRESGPVLVAGSRTAGRAVATRRFPLNGGGALLIATAAVVAGDQRDLSQGVQPDLEVSVAPEAERKWLSDPYWAPTNAVSPAAAARSRLRMNEAELVRRRDTGAVASATSSAAPEAPTVQDPALMRALDILRGLSLVAPARR